MPKQSIYPILQLAQNSDILFLTETWLLSPTRFKSTWKEYHTYGLPLTISTGRQGHLGLALLVNPRCGFPEYPTIGPSSTNGFMPSRKTQIFIEERKIKQIETMISQYNVEDSSPPM